MNSNELGLAFNIEGVGYVETRLKRSAHEVKSLAGKAFHQPYVKSACVYRNDGKSILYLKKTPEGIVREER